MLEELKKKLAEIKAKVAAAAKKVKEEDSEENRATLVTLQADERKANDEYVAALEGAQTTALENDINERIEAARTQERQKLHDDIEKLKATGTASSTKIAELEAQLAEAKKAGEAESEADKNKEKLTLANLQAALDKQAEASEARLAEQKKAHDQEIAKIHEQNRADKLEAYKARRIAEIGIDNLIPEVVTGTNEQEIEDSLVKSQQYVARTAKSLQDKANQSKEQVRSSAPPQIPANGNGGPGAGAPQGSGRDVSKMSDAEFQEYMNSSDYHADIAASLSQQGIGS